MESDPLSEELDGDSTGFLMDGPDYYDNLDKSYSGCESDDSTETVIYDPNSAGNAGRQGALDVSASSKGEARLRPNKRRATQRKDGRPPYKGLEGFYTETYCKTLFPSGKPRIKMKNRPLSERMKNIEKEANPSDVTSDLAEVSSAFPYGILYVTSRDLPCPQSGEMKPMPMYVQETLCPESGEHAQWGIEFQEVSELTCAFCLKPFFKRSNLVTVSRLT